MLKTAMRQPICRLITIIIMFPYCLLSISFTLNSYQFVKLNQCIIFFRIDYSSYNISLYTLMYSLEDQRKP